MSDTNHKELELFPLMRGYNDPLFSDAIEAKLTSALQKTGKVSAKELKDWKDILSDDIYSIAEVGSYDMNTFELIPGARHGLFPLNGKSLRQSKILVKAIEVYEEVFPNVGYEPNQNAKAIEAIFAARREAISHLNPQEKAAATAQLAAQKEFLTAYTNAVSDSFAKKMTQAAYTVGGYQADGARPPVDDAIRAWNKEHPNDQIIIDPLHPFDKKPQSSTQGVDFSKLLAGEGSNMLPGVELVAEGAPNQAVPLVLGADKVQKIG